MKRTVKEFSKITAILRGYDYDQVEAVVSVLCGSVISAVEITLNRTDSTDMIRRIADKYGDRLSVGAGTVLSAEDLQDVVEGGADFVLAPNMFSKDMLDYCKHHHVISVPGAYSPTEVYQSIKNGADIVKIFPASTLGSKYFKDIQAPFGPLPLMAVGGINVSNLQEYFKAGTSFVGIASGLFSKADIENRNIDGMKRTLEEFARQMGGVCDGKYSKI